MKALIDSKEIQVDDNPIILFSSVFDGVLQEFPNRFQDFEKISRYNKASCLYASD